MKRTIVLVGCDDSTYIDIELTSKELRVIERLAARADVVATVGCQPIIRIEPLKEEQ